jgi:hypothetical protein
MRMVILRVSDVATPATLPRDLPLVAVLTRVALAVAAREVAAEGRMIAGHLPEVERDAPARRRQRRGQPESGHAA